MALRLHHHFVDWPEAQHQRHITVDCRGNDHTVLELSHWPGNRTPAALRRDLSAEAAFAYLDRPEFHALGLAVTNNHPDEDGFIAAWALVDPEAALARRARAIEVARVGDFSRTDDLDAAKAAFAIFGVVGGYQNLEAIPELLDHPDRFATHWREEWEHFTESAADIASGHVRVEVDAALDLTIVHVADDRRTPHPLAVNRIADRGRVLTMHQGTYTLTYRYPTWLELPVHPFPPRVDLAPLARTLTAREPGAAHWVFDGIDDIVPSLHLVGAVHSAINETEFTQEVRSALRRGTQREVMR